MHGPLLAGVPHARASRTVRPKVSEVEHVTKASAARYSGGRASLRRLPRKVTGSACFDAYASSGLRAGPSPAMKRGGVHAAFTFLVQVVNCPSLYRAVSYLVLGLRILLVRPSA